MKSVRLLLIVPFALTAWGCRSTVEPDEGGVDAVAEPVENADAADAADTSDAIDGGPWHFIDGSGDCAPDGNPYTESTCCNGQPCYGSCVENQVGDVQCNCAGIVGGCTGGLVCCTTACVTSANCGLGQ